MAVSVAEARRERPSAIGALEASLAGVVVMSLLAYLVFPALGLPALDLTLLNGVTAVTPDGTDLFLAIFKLWPIGVIAGFVYAYAVFPLLSWPNWVKGLAYGLALFLLLSVIAMPVVGLLHPNVIGGRVPQPGWLGLGLGGWSIPVVLLGDHLIFGLILGAMYRPGQRSTERVEEREE